jgi:hypothetical protein
VRTGATALHEGRPIGHHHCRRDHAGRAVEASRGRVIVIVLRRSSPIILNWNPLDAGAVESFQQV